MFGNIHEECGVFGIYGRDTADVASDAYYGLFALQHRGQESCGIAVNDCGLITVYKDVGIVNDVFRRVSCLPRHREIGPSAMSATARRGASAAETPSRL